VLTGNSRARGKIGAAANLDSSCARRLLQYCGSGRNVLLYMRAYHVEHHMRARLAPMLYDETDHEAAAATRTSVVADPLGRVSMRLA
jgi:hypothetical protein